MAMRWRWPPESWLPVSPTRVSIAVRKARDELVRRRQLCRRFDNVARAAIGDIGGDRVIEQRRILRHERDLVAQRGKRHIANVLAVDLMRPSLAS